MSKRLINVITVVILVAWAISFILDAVNPSYDPPPTVHALMMAVAGAAFAGSVLRPNSKNGNGGNGAGHH